MWAPSHWGQRGHGEAPGSCCTRGSWCAGEGGGGLALSLWVALPGPQVGWAAGGSRKLLPSPLAVASCPDLAPRPDRGEGSVLRLRGEGRGRGMEPHPLPLQGRRWGGVGSGGLPRPGAPFRAFPLQRQTRHPSVCPAHSQTRKLRLGGAHRSARQDASCGRGGPALCWPPWEWASPPGSDLARR